MNTKHLINATRKMAEACAEVLEYVQPSLIEGALVELPKRKPGRPPKVVAPAPAPEPAPAKRKPGRPAKAAPVAAPKAKAPKGPTLKKAAPGPKAPPKAPKAKTKAGASPSVDSVLEILADGPKPKEDLLNAFGERNRRTAGVVISHAVRNGKAVVADDGLVSLTS